MEPSHEGTHAATNADLVSMFVFDQAHIAKKTMKPLTNAIQKRAGGARKILLTGTPTHNTETEMAHLFHLAERRQCLCVSEGTLLPCCILSKHQIGSRPVSI